MTLVYFMMLIEVLTKVTSLHQEKFYDIDYSAQCYKTFSSIIYEFLQ
jgi:hypothetical protein